MNWLKENPFLSGLAAVTVAGTGALVFLLMQASTQYQETADAYNQAVQKLHTLQNRIPFPNAENLKKTKELEDEYRQGLNALSAQLAKMETPINPDVKPQQFQDDLRSAVNSIAEKAAAAGVTLPKDFYLGFDQYKDSPPSPQATPALDRQLRVINQIVSNLIGFKIQSIDSLERLPLKEESNAPAAPAGKGDAKPASLVRLPFNIVFTAEQPKFRVAFNSLMNSDQFLIVRAMNVQNSSPAGPPVVQAEKSGAGAAPGAADNNDLNVILGREMIKVAMRIEIIDFPAVAEPQK